VAMQKFSGIEGLRGWLAWSVVISHILLFSGVQKWAPDLYSVTGSLANNAVLIFIVISGFVIAHLVISRNEPYALYLKRRALRLYPVYLVALGFGIIGTYLAFDTFLTQPWGDMSPPIDRMSRQQLDLISGNFVPHLLAHLALLHGAISSNVLYESQYMFLAPAWSLSLEWQFYLVAPVIIKGALGKRWRWGLFVLAWILFRLYDNGRLGSFILPSFLPGAVWYFAAGIICRISMQSKRRGWVVSVLALLLFTVWRGLEAAVPMFVWALFLAIMLSSKGASLKIFYALFESPIARWFGDRSYSTYLIHVPIVQISTWLAVTQMQMSPLQTFAIAAIAGIALTLVASSILRRYVEIPTIELGKRLQR